MALTWSIDAAERLAVITSDERLCTLDELRSVLDEVLADPRFEPGFSILSDRRRALQTPTIEFINGLVSLISGETRLRGVRWAVVFSTTAAYGMARMWENRMLHGPIEARAFHDVDEALAWLCHSPE